MFIVAWMYKESRGVYREHWETFESRLDADRLVAELSRDPVVFDIRLASQLARYGDE